MSRTIPSTATASLNSLSFTAVDIWWSLSRLNIQSVVNTVFKLPRFPQNSGCASFTGAKYKVKIRCRGSKS